jgi:hypothetical protein
VKVFDSVLGDAPNQLGRQRDDVHVSLIGEKPAAIRATPGEAFNEARCEQATALFTEVALADDYADFRTVPAYERTP